LKFVHFLQDAHGHKVELFYLGDVEGREVDFLVGVDKKPWFAVEVKESEKVPSRHLGYFAKKLRIPFLYQVIRTDGVDVLQDSIRTISASRFLSGLA